ncbi:hypothetical protein P43SY_005398 [Pythium insidiosum]|uniref:SRP54-type proteins GTP-binding domain-containing protein n=1 Tax=Pythium insidiosum TaxID=114742 RepID=A0AAD5LCD7_PYTIN|nr:hypothetical protein P43SY_005398 [Pythium insidiosum]
MIDHFVIFNKTGTVLWSHSPCHLNGDPVDTLINRVLMEDRSGEKKFISDAYSMQWVFENKLDLVFVVVYQKILQLLYIEELLEAVKRDFVARFPEPIASKLPVDAHLYKERFATLLKNAEMKFVEKQAHKGPRTFGGSRKGKGASSNASGKASASRQNGGKRDEVDTTDDSNDSAGEGKGSQDKFEELQNEVALRSSCTKTMRTGPRKTKNKDNGAKKKTGKQMTKWEDSKLSKKELQDLDYSAQLTAEEEEAQLLGRREAYIGESEDSDADDDLDSDEESDAAVSSGAESDSVVRRAMEAALLRILTPKKSTDVLREIMDAKAAGRAYSIVFVGVNGVGKSTSLSKVCYFLKSKGVKVLIAACDTFRSGAVEQLNQHAKVLDVPLFQKGYARDPAAVAREAVKYGTENGFDCVLIDTAGRMQNNESLMRALAKLVSSNDPDLVLFVGEALVGNDGIDQLVMFDRALADYSDRRDPHRVDGIMLTKFDTIDDKVGAAVSMVYKTGQPIMFVGTGQKYTHLKKLNVRTVLRHLLQ